MEHYIILESIDPGTLYGVQNNHLRILKGLFPKLRIVARDNVVRILGNESDALRCKKAVEDVCRYIELHNYIEEEQLIRIATGHDSGTKVEEDVIVWNASGRAIKCRGENQKLIVRLFNEKDLLFITGPAGTGKTYLSIALAVKALKEKQARRLVLSRPAVEAGEKLGFLPGDMKEKVDPYLRPMYDALLDMLPASRLEEMMERGLIEIAPLAFMRGRTLNDAVVILDEAQNTTPAQLKMFLTRMGMGTKMIVTGDITQVDLPRGQLCGLQHAVQILQHIDGIGFVEMKRTDIVRHRLVNDIVNAYSDEN